MRTRERNQILAELINRGPSTVGDLSKSTGIEKPRVLRHLTALKQDGKAKVVGEQDNQLLYNLP
jgi:predicted ArsR family transcriptional regulator